MNDAELDRLLARARSCKSQQRRSGSPRRQDLLSLFAGPQETVRRHSWKIRKSCRPFEEIEFDTPIVEYDRGWHIHSNCPYLAYRCWMKSRSGAMTPCAGYVPSLWLPCSPSSIQQCDDFISLLRGYGINTAVLSCHSYAANARIIQIGEEQRCTNRPSRKKHY